MEKSCYFLEKRGYDILEFDSDSGYIIAAPCFSRTYREFDPAVHEVKPAVEPYSSYIRSYYDHDFHYRYTERIEVWFPRTAADTHAVYGYGWYKKQYLGAEQLVDTNKYIRSTKRYSYNELHKMMTYMDLDMQTRDTYVHENEYIAKQNPTEEDVTGHWRIFAGFDCEDIYNDKCWMAARNYDIDIFPGGDAKLYLIKSYYWYDIDGEWEIDGQYLRCYFGDIELGFSLRNDRLTGVATISADSFSGFGMGDIIAKKLKY
jgi:hypothetical protein